VRLGGQLALAVYGAGASRPEYFMLLELDEQARVSLIRDFRYVPYIAEEAELEVVR
jgi:hypothetical protein